MKPECTFSIGDKCTFKTHEVTILNIELRTNLTGLYWALVATVTGSLTGTLWVPVEDLYLSPLQLAAKRYK